MFGVLLYVNHDYKFSAQAYLWITVWYVVSIFELIYVKHLVSTSNMTTWGRVSAPALTFSFTSLYPLRRLELERQWATMNNAGGSLP